MRRLSDAEETFEAQRFPCTGSELASEYGDLTVELPNGDTTVAEVFETLADEEFASSREACRTAYGVLGEDAIGRKGYSDRDPTLPGEDGHRPISL
ncbi:MAG: DUF2795 domain-containing protein [Halovenus sp.]